MNQPEIRIYTGKIQAWTRDVLSCKSRESLCGRRLLAYGLLDWGREDLFGNIHRADELYAYLEGMIERGSHGKPHFRENVGIHFQYQPFRGIWGMCPFFDTVRLGYSGGKKSPQSEKCWNGFLHKESRNRFRKQRIQRRNFAGFGPEKKAF